MLVYLGSFCICGVIPTYNIDMDLCVTFLCRWCHFSRSVLLHAWRVYLLGFLQQFEYIGEQYGGCHHAFWETSRPSKYRHWETLRYAPLWHCRDFCANFHFIVLTLRFVFTNLKLCACAIVCDFNYLNGTRVGEADNPGPRKKDKRDLKLAVCNPHAILSHKKEILNLQSDIVCVSETSATKASQSEFSHNIKQDGFHVFWSKNVESKYITKDTEYSLRGEQLGAAVVTSLPSRPLRNDISAELWSTCRIATSVVNFARMDVLIVAIYGFARRGNETRKLNDLLLAQVIKLVGDTRLPFIIAGDFNQPPHRLSSYQVLKDLGAVEAHTYCEQVLGYTLPATCRGATFNDTAIFSSHIIPLIREMQVRHDLAMDCHSPLVITLDACCERPPLMCWDIPQSWANSDLDKDLLEKYYVRNSSRYDLESQIHNPDIDPNELLLQWSSIVEKSVDATIQTQHKMDPTLHPTPGLSKCYLGRCKQRDLTPKKLKSSPKTDSQTKYEPPAEVFREISKKKVKQVRRIRSLLRAIQSASQPVNTVNLDQENTLQLQNEWRAIKRAQGYKPDWCTWALSFECISMIPYDLPDYDLLHVLAQLTEYDCNIHCKEEAKFRSLSFKHRIKLDVKEGSGKMTYSIIKGHNVKTLKGVHVVNSVEATLCRSCAKGITLQAQHEIPFQRYKEAHFGDARVRIIDFDRNIITIQVIEGRLPVKAVLKQDNFAYNAQQVSHEFHRYWTPMWLRDDSCEETNIQCWKSFLEELDDTNLPAFDLKVDVANPNIWYQTIKRMKSHSSPGVCGWRTEELKLLPFVAVKDLCEIFQRIWPYGLSREMMKSRTVLLEKVATPQGTKDTRPITILSVLARLASKIVADQTLAQLANQIPFEISGGIPKRGVQDICVNQHFQIELAIAAQNDLGGFTLDLVKAFNRIPRAPLRELFVRIGLSPEIIDYWFKSLSNLTRYPQCFGSLGQPMCSTSGIPEGDSCSVLGMVALSILYHFRIRSPKLRPYSYADNWSWLTTCEKDHLSAMIKVMNLVQSLRMEIDFRKSWTWGTTKKFRKAIQCCNFLFPDGRTQIEMLTTVKDLGSQLHYNKNVTLGSISTRINEGIKRCEKLRWVPTDMKSKAKFVQSAVWPAALYSSTNQLLGYKHWQSLRRAVARALVGDHNYASSFIACSCIVPGLQDPMLYALRLSFCNFRRLVDLSYDCAIEFWDFAQKFRGRAAFGPAGALAKYAHKCGWTLGEHGKLKGPGGNTLDLFVNSPKEISAVCTDAWSYSVYNNIQHRKGITQSPIDVALTAKVVQTLSPTEQAIIAMNISGGFQSGEVKNKWASGVDEFCPFCGQTDTKWHGIVECPAFQSVRVKHKQALKILQKFRPEWVDLPIARRHHDAPFLNLIHDAWKEPELNDIELHSDQLQGMNSHYVFYTDGACKFPTVKHAKYASWAIIQDISHNDRQRSDIISTLSEWPDDNDTLFVSATGLVVGKQSPARAELTALVLVAEKIATLPPSTTMVVYTDAQYGCDTISAIQNRHCIPLTFHLSNYDLVMRLLKVWDDERFKVQKIKAHQNPENILDPVLKWNVLGNHVADRTAAKALQVCSMVLQKTHAEVALFHEQEFLKLRQVLKFYVELNTYRVNLLKEKQKEQTNKSDMNPSQNHNTSQHADQVVANPNSFQDALQHLSSWSIPVCECCCQGNIPQDILSAMSVGATFTQLAWKWLVLLKWPPLENSDADLSQDWGISYFDLLVNMMVCTNFLMPLPISPGARYTEYCLYPSNQEALLPISQKSINCQVHAFEKFIRQLENLTGLTVIPPYPKNIKQPCKSLARLGFHPKAAGVSRRPVIPRASETMLIVESYLNTARKRGSLDKPLTLCISNPPLVELIELQEISSKERYNYAQVIRKRKARNS